MIQFLYFTVFLAVASGTEAEEPVLVPNCGGAYDLCGYVEQRSKGLRIPHSFQDAGQFSEGLAAVKIDEKYGYIDRTGKMVISPRYDLAGSFEKGLAEVFTGQLAGLIDQSGKYVVEPQFGRLFRFTGNTFLVTDSPRWRDTDAAYKLSQQISVYQERENRFGLYHIENGRISDKRYFIKKFDDFSRGLIWASENELKDAKFGLLRSDGTWQITPRYRSVSQPFNGLATVSGYPRKDGDPTLFGAVDETGELVIPLKFGGVGYPNGQYVSVRKPGTENRYGLALRNGNLLSGRYFEKVSIPRDGRLPRVLEGNRWYSVTPDGELVTDERNGYVHKTCPGGLKLFEQHGFLAVSHPKVPKTFVTRQWGDHVLHSDRGCKNPWSLTFGKGQHKIITQDGQIFPPTGWFDGEVKFHDEMAAVSLNDKKGLIDQAGAYVIPPVYDFVAEERAKKPVAGKESGTGESSRIYMVRLDGRIFWIDSNNNEIEVYEEPPILPEREKILICGGALQRFEEKGRWGMKGPDGETLIGPRYVALTCFKRGLAWGVPFDLNKWCPIAPDGEETERSLCRDHIKVTDGMKSRPEDLSRDPFLNSLLWLRAQLDYAQGKRLVPPRELSASSY
ncbi:WG repeat-containing protein [Roseibium sp. HPY-6]|uniref:WG repeat-containing protein n=1 Tax=Roseibium sp. HPY-6 TaxID=3229852 RepID=UPI00338EE54E